MTKSRLIIRFVAALALTSAAAVPCISIVRAQTAPPPATPQALEIALHRLSLTPEALTAAGLSATEVSEAVNDLESEMDAEHVALAEADASYVQALRDRDRLQRVIQSGIHEAADLPAYTSAVSQLNGAQSQRQAILDEMWSAGTGGLPQAKKNILATIRVNGHSWDMPIEFLTVERTETQWVELRDALANERISAAAGVPADPVSQALLAQLRADPTVSAAIANLASNLASATAAWNTAIND